jgi:hypothetical protein
LQLIVVKRQKEQSRATMGNSSSTQSGKDAGAKVDAAINKASSKTEKVGAKQVHARRDERR